MLNGTLLIIVDGHDVEGDELLDVLFVVGPVEFFRQVMAQLFLQCLEVGLGIIVIALKLCYAFKLFQLFLAQTVVAESTGQHGFLKLVVVGIRKLKVGG